MFAREHRGCRKESRRYYRNELGHSENLDILARIVVQNGTNGLRDIEGKTAREAASEWSRGDASDMDGQAGRPNGRKHLSERGQRARFNVTPAIFRSCDVRDCDRQTLIFS